MFHLIPTHPLANRICLKFIQSVGMAVQLNKQLLGFLKATCGLGHRSVRMFCSYMECCDESTHSTWLMWQLGWLYW